MRNSIGIAPSRRPPRYVATPALRGDESGRGVPRRAVYDWRVTTGASRAAEAPVGPSAAYRNSGMSLANSSIRRISSSQGMKPWSMIARSDATSASTPLSRRCRRSVGDLLFFGAQRGRLFPGTFQGPPSGAICWAMGDFGPEPGGKRCPVALADDTEPQPDFTVLRRRAVAYKDRGA